VKVAWPGGIPTIPTATIPTGEASLAGNNGGGFSTDAVTNGEASLVAVTSDGFRLYGSSIPLATAARCGDGQVRGWPGAGMARCGDGQVRGWSMGMVTMGMTYRWPCRGCPHTGDGHHWLKK